MSNYLDVGKSVIISSPAGSGKTEKLARRYISLLKEGVDVERILAITFTDKASAEMKQRILRILKDEDKDLFKILLEKMPLMRVSTIHSFCSTLLRRFSFEAGITPNYKIEEPIDFRITWEDILYEILMDIGGEKGARGKRQGTMEGYKLILQSLAEKGFRGLEDLKNTVNYLYEKSPFSLETKISCFTFPASYLSIVEELKNWPGAEKAIEDYKSLFKDDERLIHAERYFLTTNKEPRRKLSSFLKDIVDFQGWAEKMFLYWQYKNIEKDIKRADRIREIFRRCHERFRDKKLQKGILDFNDLEYLTYKLLTEDPEWANILYAFDEKTDHILVDEFQDTNNFQWAIIDKLTEEWRSGMGAKREEGIKPTIFLVGDEKQSIYYFRGANVEVFHRAKEKLREWLGEEFYYEEVKENFRSLPAIIDFTNHLFAGIMTADENSPSWMTRYSSLMPVRHYTDSLGSVELILLEDSKEPVSDVRQREAEIIAKRIQSIMGNLQIFDRKTNEQRTCMYSDIAVLLRKRTHLKKYEEALRRYNIPFVVVKGIGFYQEPEVAILRALVYFLSNPKDDYSLYVLLRSPLFLVDEEVVLSTLNNVSKDAPPDIFSRLKLKSQIPPVSLPARQMAGGREAGWANPRSTIHKAIAILEECLSELPLIPLSELIEKTLVRTRAWGYFYESQRRANIKKFIRIIEDLEANGKSLLKIRDFLERTSEEEKEPKANVNAEVMNAVKIMTIHESKGLEFPVVFLPGIDEPFPVKTSNNLVYESEGRWFFKHASQIALRKEDRDFLLHLRKEKEEQKRLFYVAVTRAEDALFLTGRWNDKDNNRPLSFLKQGLGLNREETGYKIKASIKGFSILSEYEVDALYKEMPKLKVKRIIPKPLEFIPIKIEVRPEWKPVTKIVDIRRRHGREWLTVGDVLHKIFEGISKGLFSEEEITEKGERLLSSKGVLKTEREKFLSIIKKDVSLLKQKRIWQDIILPRENSFTELPFILEVAHKGKDVIYTGRIDRVIIKDGIYNIYDYKTFPVNKQEIDYLLKEYSFQLDIYRKAVKRLFNAKSINSFIVFTHIGEVKEL